MRRVTRSSMRRNEDRPPPILHRIDAHEGHVLDPAIERIRRSQNLGNQYSTAQPKENLLSLDGTRNFPRTGKLNAIGWITEDKGLTIDDYGSNTIRKTTMTAPDYTMPGIMGNGKGEENGLPEYEFRSVYQYLIPGKNAKDSAPWKRDPAVPPESVKLNILSVVSSVSLGRKLDLDKISKKSNNISYDPDSFTPLVMRLKEPYATAMMFRSGKMVVTGTKSEEQNRIAVRKFARIIQKLGYRVAIKGMLIQNITATCNLGFRVRVHLLGGDKHLSQQTGYHPELFTGVSIPLSYPRAKVMVFRTGSILITGVKREEDLKKVLNVIYPHVKLYAN